MYADVNFYLESFHGTQEASCEIEASLSLAEIKIDEATFNRIKGRGFENLTEFQQEKIRLAACYQADYIHENGYDGSGIQSYSVLDITLADNTEYRLTDVTTLMLNYPTGDFECWMRLTFAESGDITVTLPADTKYIGTAPDFKNGETWELSIKDGVVVAGKVA